MKRSILLPCALLCLALLLSACSSPKPKNDATCEQVVQAVVGSRAFTEEPFAPARERALNMLMLDEASVADFYMVMDGTRATSEFCAAVRVSSGRGDEVKKALESYRDSLIVTYRDYRPEEIPKLEAAQVLVNGDMYVIAVCTDQAAAQAAVRALWK